MADNVGEKQS